MPSQPKSLLFPPHTPHLSTTALPPHTPAQSTTLPLLHLPSHLGGNACQTRCESGDVQHKHTHPSTPGP